MASPSSARFSLPRSCLWIFLSICFISGPAFLGWIYYFHLKKERAHDPQYRIIALVQASPQKEKLKTVYLAELLGLSLDKPSHLYQFDVEKGEKKLRACPLINQAIIKKIKPGTLYVDYEVRVPIAYLGDYLNAALDKEGYVFPFKPFFTPKKLPILYLGLDEIKNKGWGVCLLEDKRMALAFEILRAFQELGVPIQRLDVSQAFNESYGRREVIVTVEEYGAGSQQGFSSILRLSGHDYKQGLSYYLALRDSCHLTNPKDVSSRIIDLRIPHLAFIQK